MFFWIEDYEKVDSIPIIKKTWEYSNQEIITPCEWGKIEFDELIIKFIGKNDPKS